MRQESCQHETRRLMYCAGRRILQGGEDEPFANPLTAWLRQRAQVNAFVASPLPSPEGLDPGFLMRDPGTFSWLRQMSLVYRLGKTQPA